MFARKIGKERKVLCNSKKNEWWPNLIKSCDRDVEWLSVSVPEIERESVCVCARARERECVCVCASMSERKKEKKWMIV